MTYIHLILLTLAVTVLSILFDVDKKITSIINRLLQSDKKLDRFLKKRYKGYIHYKKLDVIKPKKPHFKFFSGGENPNIENDYIFIEATFYKDGVLLKKTLIIEVNFFIFYKNIIPIEEW